MINEPENRDTDLRVTDAYRDLATERTPGPLNEKILKMAGGAATPYARSRAWMRPAAWAATIALSFAFVLELTQLPSTGTDSVGTSQIADDDKADRADKVEIESQDRPDEDSAAKIGTLAPEPPPAASLEQAEVREDAERKRVATPAPARLDTRSKEAFVPQDMAVMRDAEDLARAQAGSDQGSTPSQAEASDVSATGVSTEAMSAELPAVRRDEADQQASQVAAEARSAAASFAVIGAAEVPDQACPPSARETPEAWLACIRQLRHGGRVEQADDEYEEFREVFPEFDDSDGDK